MPIAPHPPSTDGHKQYHDARPTLSNSSCPVVAISIIGMVTTSILLLVYYVLLIKCCFDRRRSDAISRLSRSRRRSENLLGIFSAAIQSRGLDESAIRAIPTFRYRRGGGGDDQQGKSSYHECAVCLNEFQDGERIRLLPDCFHAFHIDCIDTWFQTNASCPLCRSDVATTGPIPDDRLADLASHQNLRHSGDVAIEFNDGGSDEARPVSSSADADPPPGEAEQWVGHEKGRQLHRVSSMGDECIEARGKDERFSIQPIRRSFSVGSSSDRQLYMAVQKILQQNPHFREVSAEETSSSNSARIRRSFFSFGQHRISRSAVLPIQNEV